MAKATLTMNVDELADAIAAKVTAGDSLARKLTREVLPIKFSDPADVLGSVRKLRDAWHEELRRADRLDVEKRNATNAKVLADRDVATLRQSVDRLSDQAIELRGDLKTATDERDEYLRQLDEARAEIAAGKAASAHGFEPGEKVKAIGDGGYGPVGIAAGDVLTVRGTADGVIDDDGDLRVFNSRGGQNWIRPSNVRKLRTYKAGDPEPEDKTVTLTGEFEGRTVTLKHGRLSELQDGGGPLTWWDVSGKWPTNAVLSGGFGYWAAKYGPLTEV
ncbi:hypothetical protein PBI_HUFFY_56 [Gordonia phage Huffy]|nr:hypothetical protein PBI_HUFFY_56 [Gordonia phage Huffy]AQY55740.1 hypothetical protein PBI_DINODARYN_56 [Gordonia phage DinoDaryn]